MNKQPQQGETLRGIKSAWAEPAEPGSVVPLILAVLAVSLLAIAGLLLFTFSSLDQQASESIRERVQTALDLETARREGLLQEVTYWDEAHLKLVVETDPASPGLAPSSHEQAIDAALSAPCRSRPPAAAYHEIRAARSLPLPPLGPRGFAQRQHFVFSGRLGSSYRSLSQRSSSRRARYVGEHSPALPVMARGDAETHSSLSMEATINIDFFSEGDLPLSYPSGCL